MLSDSWHHVLVAKQLQHAALHMKHAQALLWTPQVTQTQHDARQEALSQQKNFYRCRNWLNRDH